MLNKFVTACADSNGIESYCMYLALSVVDYFHATSNAAHVVAMIPFIVPKLEHAYSLVNQSHPKLGFIAWDDRGGSGFENNTVRSCFFKQYIYIHAYRAVYRPSPW